jgi:hypothetical protein
VSRLALLLRDFPAPRRSDDARPLPRLPALERWLSRGTSAPAEAGWRGWLLRTVLGAAAADGAGAGWAAAGLLPQAAGRHFWFATPVHYLAGLDTVHLHPAGLLRLEPEQQRALAADFERVFRDSPWRLHALGFRELLLEGPDPGPHDTTEAAALLGGDLAAARPRGAGVRPLQQLAAEIEMWLHEHPLNRERERRRELPLTGLWFWGGGRSPPSPGVAHPRTAQTATALAGAWRLHADDVFSAGVAAAANLPLQPLPEAAAPAAAASATPTTIIVLPAGCDTGIEDLLRLERDWFQPLQAGLTSGRWSALTLVRGGRSHELRRAHGWRWWRRPRAWWEDAQ